VISEAIDFTHDQKLSASDNMSLNPKFVGQKLVAGVSPTAIHTLELYLDYVCP
jgi:hypothetical protein